MPRANESDSPFKRDEPVSRSRKWMLLLFANMILGLAVFVATWILDPGSLTRWLESAAAQSYMPFGEVTGFLSMMYAVFTSLAFSLGLLFLLWRAARQTKECRNKRNFDTMAAAVRSQRVFWGVLAFFGPYLSITLVAECMRMQGAVQEMRKHARNAQVEMARRQQQQQQQQQPPAPQSPLTPP